MVDIVTPCPFTVEPNCPKSGGGLNCASLLLCMKVMIDRDKRAIAKATGKEAEGTHGLKNRYNEQVNGRCGPGTDVWKTHDDQFRGLQDKLNRYVNTYNKMNPPCPDSIPDDLLEWADKAPPTANDWKGDKNAPVAPECNKATRPAKVPANQPVPVPAPPALPAPGQQDDNATAPSGSSSIDGSDIAKAAVVVGAVALGVAAVVAGAPVLAGAAAATAIVVGLGSLFGGGGSPDSA
jgi:hypothetical protein